MSAVYVSLADQLLRLLNSGPGQKVMQTWTDGLATRDDVAKAIGSLSPLAAGPKPTEAAWLYALGNKKENDMADTQIPVPANVLGIKNVSFNAATGLTMTVPHPTEAGATVEVGLKLDEILTALISAVPVYAIGKAAWEARPATEDGLAKFTYAFEAGTPAAMAIARQVIIDAKD